MVKSKKDFHKNQIDELTNFKSEEVKFEKIKSKSLPKTRNNTVNPIKRQLYINNKNDDDFNHNTFNSALNQSDKEILLKIIENILFLIKILIVLML